MELLPSNQRTALLEYMPLLRYRAAEWLIVEIKLLNHPRQDKTGIEIGDLLKDMFPDHEGRIFVCNEHEVLMFIEWGQKNNPSSLAKRVRSHLPEDSCEVTINPPTKEGLVKMVMRLAPGVDEDDNPLHQARLIRQENVILVADDDMYMRLLAKKGLEDVGSIAEVASGDEVIEAYKQHNPDMVLLDIHMPGRSGHDLLADIRAVDKKAYIIMLSADSSLDNVQATLNHGAKGFLTKPFAKPKLLDYVEKCPTIY